MPPLPPASIAIERKLGSYLLHHLPEADKACVERFMGSLFAAERKTEIAVNDSIGILKSGHMEIQRDFKNSMPRLHINQKYLTDAGITAHDMDGVLLHELGHQHYTTLTKELRLPNYVLESLDGVLTMQRSFRRDPKKVSAAIFKYYEGDLKLFREDLNAMADAARTLGEHIPADHIIRTGKDAEIASLMLDGYKKARAGETIKNTPLGIFAELPAQPYYALEEKWKEVKNWSKAAFTTEDITSAQQHISEIEKIIDSTATHSRKCARLYAAPARAEELLCDDFSIIHSDNPLHTAEKLKALMAEVETEHANKVTQGIYKAGEQYHTHPNTQERRERAAMLAKRVQAGRDHCGSLMTAESLEPASYREWVDKVHAQPSSVLSPK